MAMGYLSFNSGSAPPQPHTVDVALSPARAVGSAYLRPDADAAAASPAEAKRRAACVASVTSDATLWCLAALGTPAAEPFPPPDGCAPDLVVRADAVRIAANALLADAASGAAATLCPQAVETALNAPGRTITKPNNGPAVPSR